MSSASENPTGVPKSLISEDLVEEQCEWEDNHMGNFRRIYPCSNVEKYQQFFTQNSMSFHQETAASRARGEVSKRQKGESGQTRLSEHGNKKSSGKQNGEKRNLQSPELPEDISIPFITCDRSDQVDLELERNRSVTISKNSPTPNKTQLFCGPDVISESEEKSRIMDLAQRDYLVKSCGLLEQIYMAMKKNGVLRKKDEKKYERNKFVSTEGPSVRRGVNALKPQYNTEKHNGHQFYGNIQTENKCRLTENREKNIQTSYDDPVYNFSKSCNEPFWMRYLMLKNPHKIYKSNTNDRNSKIYVSRAVQDT